MTLRLDLPGEHALSSNVLKRDPASTRVAVFRKLSSVRVGLNGAEKEDYKDILLGLFHII
jgi:hypothetical protein